MKIIVKRAWKMPGYTIDKVYVDNAYWCNALEDTDRGLTDKMSEAQIKAVKIYGQTAIPAGVYEVRLSLSPKFSSRAWALRYGGLIPEIVGVKGFSGIRIHPGNKPEDTLGCILPGINSVKGQVTRSTEWYYKLMDQVFMPARWRQEKVTIEIY